MPGILGGIASIVAVVVADKGITDDFTSKNQALA
jgi:hypothetical protein